MAGLFRVVKIMLTNPTKKMTTCTFRVLHVPTEKRVLDSSSKKYFFELRRKTRRARPSVLSVRALDPAERGSPLRWRAARE